VCTHGQQSKFFPEIEAKSGWSIAVAEGDVAQSAERQHPALPNYWMYPTQAVLQTGYTTELSEQRIT
jgi:hypothetical protein